MVLEMFWDDVVAGPQPEGGLGRLREIVATVKPLTMTGLDGESSSASKTLGRSVSMPGTPGTPGTPSRKENVWRSVFHPGSNLATRRVGSELFDKPTHQNCPTVYDWLYSEESRSKHV